jgi:hypothetical protein
MLLFAGAGDALDAYPRHLVFIAHFEGGKKQANRRKQAPRMGAGDGFDCDATWMHASF